MSNVVLRFVPMVVLGAVGLGAADFLQRKAFALYEQRAFGPGEWAAEIPGRLAGWREGRAELAALDLAAHLPPAPEGVARREATAADRDAILYGGPAPDAGRRSGASSMLGLGGTETEARSATYEGADGLVVLTLSYLPPAARGGLAGAILGEIEAMDVAFGPDPEDRVPPVAIVDGVPLREDVRSPLDLTRDGAKGIGPHRRFSIDLGPEVDVSILTNAGDEAVRAVVAGLDLDALDALQAEPRLAALRAEAAPDPVPASAPVPAPEPAPEPEAAPVEAPEQPRAPVVRRAGQIDEGCVAVGTLGCD